MLNGRRLRDCLTHAQPEDKQAQQDGAPVTSGDDAIAHFHHFMAPTLPHLLALLVHSTPFFPPKSTSLLVVDSISTPFNHAFTQRNGTYDRHSGTKTDVSQWAAGRRWAVMGDLSSALAKLAATRKMAVVTTSQTTTKLKLECAASLVPAMTGAAWDAGINCRLLLFRDWQLGTDELCYEKEQVNSELRFAAVTKRGGGSVDGFGAIVPFAIEQVGRQQMSVRIH